MNEPAKPAPPSAASATPCEKSPRGWHFWPSALPWADVRCLFCGKFREECAK